MSLRETIPLQKSKVIKKSIGGMIGVLVSGAILSAVIAGIFYGADDDKPHFLIALRPVVWIAFALLLMALFCWTPFYQYLYWKRYHYDMDQKNITIRKGVIAQKEITLPFNRITDVYVDQDMLDVLFGLYDVHISTPTQESGLFAHIDGVDQEGCQTLRQMILDRINKDEN